MPNVWPGCATKDCQESLWTGFDHLSNQRLNSSMVNGEITERIIAAAMRIHTAVGPGLLESAYREFLYHQLVREGWAVEKEKPMPVVYEGIVLDRGYRIDLLVDNKVVVELKSVDLLLAVHVQQMLTYLKLGNFKTGLLINFQVAHLKDGLKRVSNQ